MKSKYQKSDTIKVKLREQGKIASANGNILIEGRGYRKTVHVVYFTEHQIDILFNAIDEQDKAKVAATSTDIKK